MLGKIEGTLGWEDPLEETDWQAAVQRVAKHQTGLSMYAAPRDSGVPWVQLTLLCLSVLISKNGGPAQGGVGTAHGAQEGLSQSPTVGAVHTCMSAVELGVFREE